MFTKLYEKIKSFIKNYGLTIAICIFLYFLLTMSLPYSIEAPGGTIRTDDRISNELYKSEGSFNLTYVSFIKGSVPSLLLSFILPDWDIIKNEDVSYDGESMEESFKRDTISLKSSISIAKLIAYKKANIKLDIISQDNLITYIEKESITDLVIGDNIRSYDNIKYESNDEFKNYINSLNVGDKINFEVINNGEYYKRYAQVREENKEKILGILVSTINNYDESTINYKTKSSEAGSSGGLMITLSIYDALIKEDITKGKKICGTGTIKLDGSIGEIGGIKYKVIGAYNNKCDIFIAPKENYKEANDIIKKKKYNIKLIKGTNFDQVVEDLEAI